MKFFLKSTLLLLTSLFIRCDNNAITSRDYPRLKTLPVSEITTEGVKLNAEITFRSDFKIIKYGFVWGEEDNPTIENNDQVIYSENIQSTSFSKTLEVTLKVGKTYFVRAFLQTNEFIVYGENMNFVSLGSKAPKINSFHPSEATVGDTVEIYGSNFSYHTKRNKILFDNFESKVIHSTDSLIKVFVPKDLTSVESKISINILGNKSISTSKFKLTTPSINKLSSDTGTDHSEIIISGAKFTLIKDLNLVTIGSKSAEVTSATKTKIVIKVPTGILTKRNKLSITVADQKVVSDVPFTMLAPVITDFNPKGASIRQLVTLKGNNFSTVQKGNKVYFDEIEANIKEISATSLIVEVPSEVPINSSIRVLTAEQEGRTSEHFSIQLPELNKITPQRATANKEITLTGKNFSPLQEDNKVQFNGINANILSSSKTELRVVIPLGIDHRSIEVTVSTGSHNSLPVSFEYIGGEWLSKTFFPGTTRAEAVHFVIDDNLYFGLGIDTYNFLSDFWRYNFTTETWLKLKDFPGNPRRLATSFSIANNGYVGLGRANRDTYFNDFWKYNPQNDSWEQIQDFPGEVRADATEFSINDNIFVGLGENQNETFTNFYMFDHKISNWTEIAPFPGGGRASASSFVINDLAYVGLGNNNHLITNNREDRFYVDFWKYNYQDNTWENIRDFPANGRCSTSHFAINSLGYVGMGRSVSRYGQSEVFSSFYEYNPTLDTWVETESNRYGSGYGSQTFIYKNSAYLFQIERQHQNTTTSFQIFRPY